MVVAQRDVAHGPDRNRVVDYDRALLDAADAENRNLRLIDQRQAVDRAEEELNYATIRSPIGGMVLSRDVEIGSPVSSILNMGAAATLVMVLGDISQVYVRGKVESMKLDESEISEADRQHAEQESRRYFELAHRYASRMP